MYKIKFEEQVKLKIMQALGIVEEDPYEIVLCSQLADMEKNKINLMFDLSQLSLVESQLQFMSKLQKTVLRGKTTKGEVKIEIDEILYIESFGNDIYAYTSKETVELPNKLYQLSEQLETLGFIRIGKSCIVNIARVYAIKPHFNGKLSLTLDNNKTIEVNRTYVSALKQYLKK